jgi:single-stranded DNA-binding protein
MQKVLLIGYLGRDPEVKYSTQGYGDRVVLRRNH